MQNVCPTHVPDIVVYIDAITIILEEASKAGSPLSVPIACIEAGTDHNLPNLALRLFLSIESCSLLVVLVERIHMSFLIVVFVHFPFPVFGYYGVLLGLRY